MLENTAKGTDPKIRIATAHLIADISTDFGHQMPPACGPGLESAMDVGPVVYPVVEAPFE